MPAGESADQGGSDDRSQLTPVHRVAELVDGQSNLGRRGYEEEHQGARQVEIDDQQHRQGQKVKTKAYAAVERNPVVGASGPVLYRFMAAGDIPEIPWGFSDRPPSRDPQVRHSSIIRLWP